MNVIRKNQSIVEKPSFFESLAVNAALHAVVNRVFKVGHAAWVSHKRQSGHPVETGQTITVERTIVGSTINPTQYLFSSRTVDTKEYIK